MLTVGIALTPLLLTVAPQVSAGPSTFTWNWLGTPVTAQPWQPGSINNWDLILHNRDNQNSVYMVQAQHGLDCAPFPATHPVTQFADSVFICKDHLMTALNGGGYSEIVMTPAQLLDFSNGGSVQFALSTAKTNNRDWTDVWISPFSSQLLLPSGGVPPDLQGPTANALALEEESGIPTTAHLKQFRNCGTSATCVITEANGTGRDIESCVAPLGGVSASRRDTRVLTLTSTHITYSIMVNGTPCVLMDTNYTAMGFTQAVIQFGHHSYAPDEGTACNFPGCVVNLGAGAGNTWHWSNVSMSPAVPFTMLRGDMPLTGIQAGTTPTVKFAAPAPPNSFLRFSALAKRGSITVSSNGGPAVAAQEQVQKGDGVDGVSDGSHIGYWTPIPAGTTSVTFSAQNSAACCGWAIQDVSIWSQTPLGTAIPSPSPSPSALPTPTAIPTPTAVPTPTAKPPVSITNAPCTVTIGGVQQTGTCTGTFQP
jgi:hypothetical protein